MVQRGRYDSNCWSSACCWTGPIRFRRRLTRAGWGNRLRNSDTIYGDGGDDDDIEVLGPKNQPCCSPKNADGLEATENSAKRR